MHNGRGHTDWAAEGCRRRRKRAQAFQQEGCAKWRTHGLLVLLIVLWELSDEICEMTQLRFHGERFGLKLQSHIDAVQWQRRRRRLKSDSIVMKHCTVCLQFLFLNLLFHVPCLKITHSYQRTELGWPWLWWWRWWESVESWLSWLLKMTVGAFLCDDPGIWPPPMSQQSHVLPA